MYRGYIAIWRKIRDNELWKEKRTFSKIEAWIDILMEARHSEEPQNVTIGNQQLTCHYGQTLRSLEKWALRWRWTKWKVRRFLKLLERRRMVKLDDERVTTRISVLNYATYDPKKIVPLNDSKSASTTTLDQKAQRLSDSIKPSSKGERNTPDQKAQRQLHPNKNVLSNNDSSFTELNSLLHKLPQFERFITSKGRYLVNQDK